MDDERFQRIEDARVLRAVAHPIRNRILAELEASGPLRATDIAERVDVPANQASFHLRQLAKYHLVEEAPELARDGRERVWRAVSPSGWTVNLRELEKEPGGAAAVAVFQQHASTEAHRMVDRIFRRERDPDQPVMVIDLALRLTAEESRQLGRELNDLLDGWRTRTRSGTSERGTQRLLMLMQPYDEPREN